MDFRKMNFIKEHPYFYDSGVQRKVNDIWYVDFWLLHQSREYLIYIPSFKNKGLVLWKVIQRTPDPHSTEGESGEYILHEGTEEKHLELLPEWFKEVVEKASLIRKEENNAAS